MPPYTTAITAATAAADTAVVLFFFFTWSNTSPKCILLVNLRYKEIRLLDVQATYNVYLRDGSA